MKKAMETVHDLIEEAKLRTVWWALCIFTFSYFLSHTSKSMWMNVPVAILFCCGLRILVNEVEFRWKVRQPRRKSYFSYLERNQLPLNDPRLSNPPPSQRWKRKIDSPIVEAAMNDFISKLLKDFVVDLWYSDITPDKEVPELMHAVIMDALGVISIRIKEINLVDLLTKDIVDLIGNHLDLFRRNQTSIGVDVMATLSSEARDERLKYHLMSSGELHPALISPESEYKVLQHLTGGLLAVVLKPREAQCPLVRSISRELLTCLVLQPVMNLASPGYINELIESIFIASAANNSKETGGDLSKPATSYLHDHSLSECSVHEHNSTSNNIPSSKQGSDMVLAISAYKKRTYPDFNTTEEEAMNARSNDWARKLEAATQRRTEVLAPENLENMWAKGRNYKKKEQKKLKTRAQEPVAESSPIISAEAVRNFGRGTVISKPGVPTGMKEKLPASSVESVRTVGINKSKAQLPQDLVKESFFLERHVNKVEESGDFSANGSSSRLKKSNSTSDLKPASDADSALTSVKSGTIIPDFFSANTVGRSKEPCSNTYPNNILRNDGEHLPKLRCRIMGAYFEKLGSKSFAVYSIAVTDAQNRTWFVKRRYSNFERLHRHLKDIPNYTLHLPPKRIFSSSTEDAFVHQRCIQLDKYLQDLLSIANVAEQHEVWDFLSISSKSYSFGKSSSVMRTLAVNVDDAVDDIIRQFKGVSDTREVVGPSFPSDLISSAPRGSLSFNVEDINREVLGQSATESMNSVSDHEDGDKDGSYGSLEDESNAQVSGWHSDNELHTKSTPTSVVKGVKNSQHSGLEVNSEEICPGDSTAANTSMKFRNLEDPIGMPPEWTPPNVSVPLLNLVDKVFQLKRRGWIRRQVFWISKQILHLVMEDAIDDWLLRQIHWLRQEETVAQGICWVQDVLWPNGTFFTKLRNTQSQLNEAEASGYPFQITGELPSVKVSKPGSFEEQLEATRRASDVKKIIYDGAPATLVNLIGPKQYKRCARDIYNFLQSNICVKQLAYSALERLLISVFPELQNVVIDVHQKMGAQQLV